MPNPSTWRDDAWLVDILKAAQRIQEYAHGLDRDSFLAHPLRQDAILRQLTIIGEAAKRLSPEFRSSRSEIPWRDVAGFRDVVVHDYFNVELEEVWRIVRDDVPTLLRLVAPLVPPEE